MPPGMVRGRPEQAISMLLAQAVKVNSLGKWKTALQMVAMSGMLLLHRPENVLGADHRALEHLQWATYACLLLLWAGAFLSVGSLLHVRSLTHAICFQCYAHTTELFQGQHTQEACCSRFQLLYMWHANGCSLTLTDSCAKACTGVVAVKLHGQCLDIHEVSRGRCLAARLAWTGAQPSTAPQPQGAADVAGWQARICVKRAPEQPAS